MACAAVDQGVGPELGRGGRARAPRDRPHLRRVARALLESYDLALLDARSSPRSGTRSSRTGASSELLLAVAGRGDPSTWSIAAGAPRNGSGRAASTCSSSTARRRPRRRGAPAAQLSERDARLITTLSGAIFNFTRWSYRVDVPDAVIEVSEAECFPRCRCRLARLPRVRGEPAAPRGDTGARPARRLRSRGVPIRVRRRGGSRRAGRAGACGRLKLLGRARGEIAPRAAVERGLGTAGSRVSNGQVRPSAHATLPYQCSPRFTDASPSERWHRMQDPLAGTRSTIVIRPSRLGSAAPRRGRSLPLSTARFHTLQTAFAVGWASPCFTEPTTSGSRSSGR